MIKIYLWSLLLLPFYFLILLIGKYAGDECAAVLLKRILCWRKQMVKTQTQFYSLVKSWSPLHAWPLGESSNFSCCALRATFVSLYIYIYIFMAGGPVSIFCASATWHTYAVAPFCWCRPIRSASSFASPWISRYQTKIGLRAPSEFPFISFIKWNWVSERLRSACTHQQRLQINGRSNSKNCPSNSLIAQYPVFAAATCVLAHAAWLTWRGWGSLRRCSLCWGAKLRI